MAGSKNVLACLIVLIACCLRLSAQVPAPPPPPDGGWQPMEAPKRQWTLAIHGGILGFSPTETHQISGSARFERTGNFGMGFLTDNNGRRRFSITANTSLGITAGTILANKESTVFHTIEGSFSRNKACYSFYSPFYFTFQNDTFAKWVMTDKYIAYGLSYQVSVSVRNFGWRLNAEYVYLRGTVGQSVYHQNFNEPIRAGRYEDWSENGTGMRATTIKASQQSWLFSFEMGFRNFTPEFDRSWDFGVVAHLPLTATYTDKYEFVQNNTSVGVSTMEYTGATVMMNFRYTFNFKPKEKPIDSSVVVPDIYVSTDTSRDIDVQESFEVNNRRVKVRVWDRNEVDGDVVSLFLNDQLVKKDLRLRKRKRSFTLKLKPGSNILVMYAENLGTIPPNTAALEIKDGRKKRNVNLVSDNGKSGAVELIYVPK